ncbi:hypothetical protein N7492_006596 [Penicillium capsulatum]|uniref:Uncharacterized protein n=1 Tax=Penicillium capsulatum TaxID=69766 RepID=A0A9W9HY86_9EURO|nr:hypothetical protein N7492_006596 [Penicillium capsulatum]KAJ6116431.1 hypothetical protein N7512_006156 [Penicillium capsulatum]
MHVAEILSDITSLRVCGYNEALALVSVHKVATPQSVDAATALQTLSPAEKGPSGKKSDDLHRAKELVQLHDEIKSRHSNGEVDDSLRRAREDVEYVMRALA